MAYQALYRKYRPTCFAEVVGQEHITTTLKNQIIEGKISHAYLFSGTRGTGKTSTAKILARAVNCLEPVNGEACGKCAACLHKGETTDIIEIDAASNNSVEQMRSLIEKAQFAPVFFKYKVYIIDEVHSLSKSAFNALLKTLEEPPEHCIFILATTELQALPATIISRCQRFDFYRITVDDIVGLLERVIADAGAHIEREGLNAIARIADGGMRNALSLADQCLAFCGDELSAEDVYSVIGTIGSELLFSLVDALLDSDSANAISLFDSAMSRGRDVNVIASDLCTHFRALMLTMTLGSCADMINCTNDVMNKYLEQSKRCTIPRAMRALEILTAAQQSIRYATMPRVIMESALFRITKPEDSTSVDALEDRIAKLEQELEQYKHQAPLSPAPADTAPVAPKRTAPKKEQAVAPDSAAKPSAPAANDADEIWRTTLNGLKKSDPASSMMMKKAVGTELRSSTLVVKFDSAMYYNCAKEEQTRSNVDAELKRNFPELTFFPELSGKNGEEKLKDFFGNGLQILD